MSGLVEVVDGPNQCASCAVVGTKPNDVRAWEGHVGVRKHANLAKIVGLRVFLGVEDFLNQVGVDREQRLWACVATRSDDLGFMGGVVLDDGSAQVVGESLFPWEYVSLRVWGDLASIDLTGRATRFEVCVGAK